MVPSRLLAPQPSPHAQQKTIGWLYAYLNVRNRSRGFLSEAQVGWHLAVAHASLSHDPRTINLLLTAFLLLYPRPLIHQKATGGGLVDCFCSRSRVGVACRVPSEITHRKCHMWSLWPRALSVTLSKLGRCTGDRSAWNYYVPWIFDRIRSSLSLSLNPFSPL